MSVIYVVLGFVLICLVLVHVNLHQKKEKLYNFIQKIYKTLLTRHKKIHKLISLLDLNPQILEIIELSEKTLKAVETNSMTASQRIHAEVLIEEKMKILINTLETQTLSNEVQEAIESYKKTQKKVDKNKAVYNEMIEEFIEACNIKPANWYAAFEKIDMDYPRLITD